MIDTRSGRVGYESGVDEWVIGIDVETITDANGDPDVSVTGREDLLS